MSHRPPDQSLRRLVAELATASPEDVGAVLDGLEPAHRRQVQALLADYLGEAAPPPVTQPPAIPIPSLGLSAWLMDRVDGAEGIVMTPAAMETLRACAVALEPQPLAETPAPPPEASWLAKAGRRLFRREAAP